MCDGINKKRRKKIFPSSCESETHFNLISLVLRNFLVYKPLLLLFKPIKQNSFYKSTTAMLFKIYTYTYKHTNNEASALPSRFQL